MNRIPLKELCTLVMGQSPSSDSYNKEKRGLPFYQGNADFGKLHPVTRVWCDEPKKLAYRGNILISVRAPIGAINIAEETCCIGRGLAAIIPKLEKCDLSYLFYVLSASCQYLQNRGTGSTFKAVNKDALENLPVPDYDKKEQHAIGQKFQQIDKLIDNYKRQIDLLEGLVESRFIEMFGSIKKLKKADDVCSIIVDCPHSTPKYDGNDRIYPCIRTSEIRNGIISWNSMKYVSVDEYNMRTKRLCPKAGDIIYAREGSYGDCVIVPGNINICLGQRTMLFRPDYTICNSVYLHCALRSDDVKRQADYLNAGSTVPHVNVADAKNFMIKVPSLESQSQFAYFVEQVDKSKLAIQKSLDELETLKKSLMQQYFG